MYGLQDVARASSTFGSFRSAKSTFDEGLSRPSDSTSVGHPSRSEARPSGILPDTPRASSSMPSPGNVEDPPPSPATFRALLIGTIVALINGSLDMYSLFRSNGLGAYWALIVSFFLLKALDQLPSGGLWRWLHPPGGASPQKRCHRGHCGICCAVSSTWAHLGSSDAPATAR